ncbi:uncharacterized protein LOC119689923 [Teleopsis dalmanni]|uniref:uncharacterized protein LOC119689923 n=1 Tax=Teleopsis dalmanni TaxID=139649 RepID=UPI0018CE7C33|nr:uncharacterized protein LOC119689923 [Teleopsis dalmanni]
MSSKASSIMLNLVRKFLYKEMNKQISSEGPSEHLTNENRILPYRYWRMDETIKNNKVVVAKLVEWIKHQNKPGIWKKIDLTQEYGNQLCKMLTRKNIDLCKIYNSSNRFTNPIRYDETGSKTTHTSDICNDELLKKILEDFTKYVTKGYIAASTNNREETKVNKISLYRKKDTNESPISDLFLSTVNNLPDYIKKNKKKCTVDNRSEIESIEKITIDTNNSDNTKADQKCIRKSPEEIAISSNEMIKIFQKRNVIKKIDNIYQLTERYDELNIEVNMPKNASSVTARRIKMKESKSISELITGIKFL